MPARRRRQSSAAAEAFDRAAPSYDRDVGGEIFTAQRRQVHAVLLRAFPPGCRVLEIGCGTGTDTALLATHGVRVVACDPADGMVSRTGARLAAQGVASRVTLLACGLDEVGAYLPGDGPCLDGIVSNFGALNCVERLDSLGALARDSLRPGGTLVLGLMGRICAGEALYFMATRRPRLAGRRLARGPVPVPVAGIPVPTFYHRPSEVCRALGPDVLLTAVRGLGVLVPPPFLEPCWLRMPRGVRRACLAADGAVSRWPPFNRLGDHVLLTLMKRRVVHG